MSAARTRSFRTASFRTASFRTASFRTASFAHALVAITVAVSVTACGPSAEEVDALTAKLFDDCAVAPAMPDCCFDDDACRDFAYERFIRTEATRPETRECLRGLDCAGSGPENVDELTACLVDEDVRVDIAARDPDCVAACFDALFACGDAGCGVAGASVCFNDHDACIGGC